MNLTRTTLHTSHFTLYILIFYCSVALTGCEQDIDGFELPPSSEAVVKAPVPAFSTLGEDFTVEREVLDSNELDQLAVYLTGLPINRLDAKDSKRTYRRIIKQTLAGQPLVIRNKAERYKIMTFVVPDSTATDNLMNLVILKQKGKPRQAQIYRYALSDGFQDSLSLGLVDMADYTGKVNIYPKEALERLFEKSENDCFELAITSPSLNHSGPSGGGGGGSSGPTISGGPTYGGPSGGIPGGNAGEGINGCTSVYTTKSYRPDGSYEVIIIIEPCGRGPYVRETPGGNVQQAINMIEGENLHKLGKSISSEDCGSLLKLLGIVGRNSVSGVAAGSRDEQKIEIAISGTSYSQAAVAAIINVSAFKNCGASIGCVNTQVAGYLENIVYADHTFGLKRNFSSLSTDQLAVLLNSVFGSSRNDDVVAAVRYVVMRSSLINSTDLATHLLVLAVLHQDGPQSFSELASDYTRIVESGYSLSEISNAILIRNLELIPAVAEALEKHAGINLNQLITLSATSQTPGQLCHDLTDLYSALQLRERFTSLTEEQVAVLDKLPGLLDGQPRGAADMLWGDRSKLESAEIAPVIAAYILKAVAKSGAAALLDIGVQFGFEYLLGDHESLAQAVEAFDVDWWSVLGSAVEANLKPKYATYVGAGSGALQSVYQAAVSDEDLTIEDVFSEAVFGAVKGFIAAHLGDHIGRFTGGMIKFGYSGVRKRITDEFGDELFVKLCRDYSVFRKDALRALWKETGVIDRGHFSRGFLIEEILSVSRYKNATWINLNGELSGPVDFVQGQTAIQLKSIADISPLATKNFRASARKALKQLDQALTDGVTFDGRVHNITDVTLDFVVPEEMAKHIGDSELEIQKYLLTYVTDNPQYFQSLDRLNFVNTVDVNIGIFND